MKLLLLEDFAANTYSLYVAALYTLCSHMQLYGIHNCSTFHVAVFKRDFFSHGTTLTKQNSTLPKSADHQVPMLLA